MIFVTAMALEILPLRRHFRHSKMSFKIDKNNEAIAVTNIMISGLFKYFEVFHFLAFIDTREILNHTSFLLDLSHAYSSMFCFKRVFAQLPMFYELQKIVVYLC